MIADALGPSLRRACSPYTGIVRSLEECLHFPDEPPIFRVSCEVGRGSAVLGTALDHLGGIGGAGTTRAEAAAAAVGEAIERYSLTYVDPHRLVIASADELGDEAVDPNRFALFSARQYAQEGFPFVPFSAATRTTWVDGWRIRDGARAWLPAQLVFLADTALADAARIGYGTSSGAACGDTRGAALERALAELLERDAFMILWANRLSLPRLDVSEDEELAEVDRTTFAVTGLQYTAVALSCFHGLPSFVGVVRSPHRRIGALGVGAGSAATVRRAWWKALSEAFACRAAGEKLLLLAPQTAYGVEGAGVVTFEDHIRYYADADRAEIAAFLDGSSETVSPSDVPELEGDSSAERVAALCERIRRAGSEAYAVDVTSPDVRDLGLVVAKAIAPELCPLEVPHGARFLGGRRLYAAPAALGLAPHVLAENDVNPEPHPFP